MALDGWMDNISMKLELMKDLRKFGHLYKCRFDTKYETVEIIIWDDRYH